MQRNKIKIYLVFVLVLFVAVLFFSLKDNFKEIIYNLTNVNAIWLIIGIIFVYLSKYFIGLTTYELAIKENKNISLLKMIKIALIYPFYAGITPSSIGGEGFEIFYLRKCNITYGGATNIQVQKFILYNISLIAINIIAVFINFFTGIVVDSSLVGSAVTISFIVNFILLGGSYLITYNKWFKTFVVEKFIIFLNKIRIIQDIDKSKEKIDDFMKNFDDGAKSLRNDKKTFWKLVIYNIVSLVFLLSATWPIARAMHITNISCVNLFILGTYARMMCLLVVTPGTSGAAEYCFIYLFNGLVSNDGIIAYMLIWRVVTYYIPLLTGGLLALMWERSKKNEKTISIKS